jgi:membrane protein insertase Oxa1/YidC/SpoIIIJ
MTNPNEENLQISRNYSICKPEEEEAIPIPLSDWRFLKDKLDLIEVPKNLFTLIGTTLLGIFTSGVFAVIALSTELSKFAFRIWFVTIVALIIGILLIIIDYFYLKRYSTYTKSQMVDEMGRIEKKYKIRTINDNSSIPLVKS